MSQLKLTADSGGGTVAIKGPASTAGNAAIELTVPGTGNSTLATTSTAGKILQVVPTVTNGAASVTISNAYANNSSYIYYLTSLNTTLTTTAANSKILISANIFGEANQVDNIISFVLSSSINSGTDTPIDTLRGPAYGDRGRVTAIMSVGYYGNDQDSTPSVTSFSNFVYEPNQASGTAITIKVGVVNTQGTGTFYLNRTVTDTNSTSYEKGVSSLTLMEVAA